MVNVFFFLFHSAGRMTFDTRGLDEQQWERFHLHGAGFTGVLLFLVYDRQTRADPSIINGQYKYSVDSRGV